jgi:carbon-monoxide dehydrogenase medium subunit
MRSYLPDFPVISPTTLDEALSAMASGKSITPLAGGTDIMVYMDSGILKPTTLLNLYALEQFHQLPDLNEGLALGPLSTYQQTRDSVIAKKYPMLAQAAREVSVLAIQSRATWIGNIANASPAADGVPALMAHDAIVELSSQGGVRKISLDSFYQGYKQTIRNDDELITSVTLPEPEPGWQNYYRKVGTRRFQAISKTLLAARIKLSSDQMIEDVRMVFASVAPHTLRAVQTESLLRGQVLTPELIESAVQAIQDEISPIDDIRSNEAYRRKVTGNLVCDFLSTFLK